MKVRKPSVRLNEAFKNKMQFLNKKKIRPNISKKNLKFW